MSKRLDKEWGEIAKEAALMIIDRSKVETKADGISVIIAISAMMVASVIKAADLSAEAKEKIIELHAHSIRQFEFMEN